MPDKTIPKEFYRPADRTIGENVDFKAILVIEDFERRPTKQNERRVSNALSTAVILRRKVQ